MWSALNVFFYLEKFGALSGKDYDENRTQIAGIMRETGNELPEVADRNCRKYGNQSRVRLKISGN
jgi:hypothetical protein